jgi:hypothetical protein
VTRPGLPSSTEVLRGDTPEYVSVPREEYEALKRAEQWAEIYQRRAYKAETENYLNRYELSELHRIALLDLLEEAERRIGKLESAPEAA